MSYWPVIELLDTMIATTATKANAMAELSGFDHIGAGAGVGVRIAALQEARASVVVLGLREHEARDLDSAPKAPSIKASATPSDPPLKERQPPR